MGEAWACDGVGLVKRTKEQTTAQLNAKWNRELVSERALMNQEQAALQAEVSKKKEECGRLEVSGEWWCEG